MPVMAIRFRCGACSQPIEVDDEWASKMVACPFCHKTITAPTESTLEDLGEVPVASTLIGTDGAGPSFASVPSTGVSPASRGNTLAIVALILACCAFVFVLSGGIVFASHRAELARLHESLTQTPNVAGQLRAQAEFLESNPDILQWLLPGYMLLLASALIDLTALVCGVIAICRPQRRGMATAALLITGIVPIFACCGGVLLPVGG
jgi:hypothetical protein